MSSVFGDKIKLSIFGESHGLGIGVVIDGLPAGLEIDLEEVKKEMRRRAPGRNKMSTPRKEKDEVIIQSGIFEGKTTGTPICGLILNTNQSSKDYSYLKNVMRPSHADYPGKIKYEGYNDYRGGGSFSGRLTAPLVFAGSLAKQYLKKYGIFVGAHISSVGKIKDDSFNTLNETKELFDEISNKEIPVINDRISEDMEKEISKARENKNSIGGKIECMIINVPAGIGEPFFDSVESRLSHMLFSIPAVKGVEFGLGFQISEIYGDEANDPMYIDNNGEVKTRTNNNGGILGGITNGMPVIFRVGIKPTPSIGRAQETVNIETKENTILEVNGRHDPCIVQRAVPVVESVAAVVILDLLLSSNLK
ncbi:chorismate synthase [Fusobacterium sp. MFO224]|uniref:chorismate synthase n=1 Tax=Fusobacterium sp. MFO224 TaxID=3378070 RepID=UPI003854D22B